MSLSIAIIQDTRRAKKSKKYPLKLRITLDRKTEYYPTIYDLTEEDYKKFAAPHIGADLQSVRKKLETMETDSRKAAGALEPFSFKEFEEEFIKSSPFFRQRKKRPQPFEATNHGFDITPYVKRIPILTEVHPDKEYISATFAGYIRRLLEEGRIGTALSYQNSYNSLKKFRGNVPFLEITKQYLTQYEQWMVNTNKCSRATVGINLRPLRAMFNEAIENGIIKSDKYPFGKRRYRIPTARNIKKALKGDSFQMIYEYEPEEAQVRKGKAYWLFCYFGNGMNPRDFANLKYKNIDGEYLYFTRAKTERTTIETPKIITVYLNEDMLQIIEEWGNRDRSPNNYIFPVINMDDNPMRQYEQVSNLALYISNAMKVISKALDLGIRVNNMVGRHSLATALKRAGASTEYIQETLGHFDKRTTENYLDNFENDIKKEFSAKLTSFKNKDRQDNGTDTF